MPYGITQCYLPPGSGDFHAFTLADLVTPEGCKVVVTSQDTLPAKYSKQCQDRDSNQLMGKIW